MKGFLVFSKDLGWEDSDFSVKTYWPSDYRVKAPKRSYSSVKAPKIIANLQKSLKRVSKFQLNQTKELLIQQLFFTAVAYFINLHII